MRLAGFMMVSCFMGLLFAGCTHQHRIGDEDLALAHRMVSETLDRFHNAAANAAEGDYFSLFAPDGVFIGTDDSERWTVEQFRSYAHPFFSQGKGWTYTSVDRHIEISSDGRTAWFDEQLENSKWGRCRGSGVLVPRAVCGGFERWRHQVPMAWAIAQYNLTVPIPNDLLPEVAERIRAFEAK